MKRTMLTGVAISVLGAAVMLGAQGQQQQQTPPPSPPPQRTPPFVAQMPPRESNDPRVGLKAGLTDAGTAALNIELVGHIDKPEAWQDPNGGFDYMNSDLAFEGTELFLGNFNGFNFYDVEDPKRAAPASVVPVPGRPGRRVGLQEFVVHVGRGRARPR